MISLLKKAMAGLSLARHLNSFVVFSKNGQKVPLFTCNLHFKHKEKYGNGYTFAIGKSKTFIYDILENAGHLAQSAYFSLSWDFTTTKRC